MSSQAMDYLSMSDEEWAKAATPSLEELTIESPAEEPEEVVEPEAEEPAAEAVTEEAAAEDETEAEAPEPEAKVEDEAVEEETKEADDKEEADQDEPDYKAVYEKLTKPFKANGKEIQIKDVDDAIQLMQMGANYNKKMAALKPNLALMKMLENNGLLSEEKISFLIDLEKKNPDAINKLIKDSGIDPMDIDAEKANGYRPNTYRVDNREIELDQVLDEIQESPAYNRTLEVVSKEWDANSKQTIANAPQLLKVINSHVESGIYDMISQEMERERMFGRLNGLSAIEAYRKIGDAIQARGGFNHLGRQMNTAPAKQVIVPAKPSQEQVQKVKDRKRAASSTTAVAPSQKSPEFNPLALSDEEFSKLVKTNYL